MAAAEQLVTANLDIWSSAIKAKSAAGRGKSNKLELYGIKKLRELILELAVRGLLVPQDPNEEPASELLKRIATEKAKLVKEKKIKKPKVLPPMAEDDRSFTAPEGWEWAKLQDISEYIQRGKGPKYSDIGAVRVVSQKCIQWGGFSVELARHVDDSSLDKYQEERYLKDNDLLWNSTGTGTVGRINLIKDVAAKALVADSHVTVIRTLLEDAGFICSYISSAGIQNRMEPSNENPLVSGTTNQVELNTSSVVNLPIPVPPLPEQARIVAKVDELMALCDQLEQQQETSITAHQTLVQTLLDALTTASERDGFTAAWARIADHFDTLFTTEWSIDQLKQTILQLAVMGKLVRQDPNDEPASELVKKIAAEKAKLVKDGKIKKQKALPAIEEDERPFEVPGSWEWVPWGEILAFDNAPFKRGPFGSSLKKDMFVASGYKVYEQYCPINDDCSFERYYITDKKYEELKGFAVKARDYLVSCSGVTLGRITQVPEDFKEGIINQALLRVRINHELVDDEFFKFLFRSPFFQKAVYANSTGSAIPNVKGVKELKVMPVPLLPIKEQESIVAKLEELMALCDTLKTRINTAQTTQLQLADALGVGLR
ncbi:Type I restriction-modification system specificity [uncultured Woeseiaceae bacterium]|uniref:Type I restriction-modification system specificity n=1 Tax=uncultured Woeseiaceae bacterium TaxID=1983305 RepID=A0A7D9D2G6_9GAMM|nr:Type I restriction-modification system specificity [uncultured Woeseiaceae bacterium]